MLLHKTSSLEANYPEFGEAIDAIRIGCYVVCSDGKVCIKVSFVVNHPKY